MTLRQTCIVPAMVLAVATAAGHETGSRTGRTPGATAAAAMRPVFHANAGQFPRAVRYAATSGAHRLYLADDAATAVVIGTDASHAVRWRFAGARAAHADASDPQAGVAHYFSGDPARWRTGVPTFGRVAYRGLYRGIDAVYYGVPGAVEFDLEVAPGGNPRDVRIAIEGASSVEIDARGAVRMATPAGDLRWEPPEAYQGTRESGDRVAARYRLDEHDRIAFDIAAYDTTRPLVIDPVITFSTFLGGIGADGATAVVVNAGGEAYVVGSTVSADFPVTPGAIDPTHVSSEAFVGRLSADGTSLVFSTFLGGSAGDSASGVALDPAGFVYVTGSTTSADFPAVNAYQPMYRATNCPILGAPIPCSDAFVTKLAPAGDAIVYSTYFGGAHHDNGIDLAVDAAGHAYLLGRTTSPDLPLVNPVDATYEPGGCGAEGLSMPCPDPFVVKWAPDGASLHYSTYLGGGFDETAGGITVDASQRAVVVGSTNSSNFPTVNALQPARAPGSCGVGPIGFLCHDVFVSRLAPGGGVLEFSTYFGGSGDDRALDVAFGPDATIWLAGHTTSPDLPLAQALQPALAVPSPSDAQCFPQPGFATPPCPDVLVVRLDAEGAALLNSTYLGGVRRDEARAIAVDATGRIAIAGHTQSADYPVVDAWQWGFNAAICPQFVLQLPCSDAFVTTLQPGGTSLAYSTFLGGLPNDIAESLAAAGDGTLFVAGGAGPDFPTTPLVVRPTGSNSEAFMTRLAAPPAHGILATFAGTGKPGPGAAATMQALAASFGALTDVAVDPAGLTRYVVDSSNHRVFRILPGNLVQPFAGTGSAGFSGDGGPATAAELNSPNGVTVDLAGTVYIADSGNHRIRMVPASGEIRTIAGTGSGGWSGDGGPAWLAELNFPMGLTAFGNVLVVADTGNHRVRLIANDGTISTVAGNGEWASSGDGGRAEDAALALPTGVAMDDGHRLHIVDFGANTVRRVTRAGVISTLAAGLAGPFGIDTAGGHTLVTELFGHRVRRIAPDGTVSTVAGTGAAGPIVTPARDALASPLMHPAGVAIDGVGNALLTDIGNFRVGLLHGVMP